MSAGRVSLFRVPQSIPTHTNRLRWTERSRRLQTDCFDYLGEFLEQAWAHAQRPPTSVLRAPERCSWTAPSAAGSSRPTGARRRQRRDRRGLRNTWPALCRPDCLQSDGSLHTWSSAGVGDGTGVSTGVCAGVSVSNCVRSVCCRPMGRAGRLPGPSPTWPLRPGVCSTSPGTVRTVVGGEMSRAGRRAEKRPAVQSVRDR